MYFHTRTEFIQHLTPPANQLNVFRVIHLQICPLDNILQVLSLTHILSAYKLEKIWSFLLEIPPTGTPT